MDSLWGIKPVRSAGGAGYRTWQLIFLEMIIWGLVWQWPLFLKLCRQW